MSKLLKSKFLLGTLVLVAALVISSSANAAITSTLKLGQRSAQVTELQNDLGVTPATGYFGTKTLAAVKAFQAAHGLVVDGIFGAKGRAALGTSPVSTTTYPAGCTSTSAYSSTTGQACTGTVTTSYPAGCTSTMGYSATTGASCNGTVTTTNPSGPLSVSLASDSPVSGTIVAGQATADLLHFALSGSGTLSSITLQRNGVSDQSTLSNVYLYNGVTRLTDGYSFNNSGVLTMSGLNIPVSGSMVLSVRADVWLSTTSYDISVGLISYTVSGGTATTVSNINGSDMHVATGASLATASIGTNTIAVASSPSVNPGTTGYTLWSAPITVGTRSLFMKSANFRVIGSAPTDALANMSLYEDGSLIGSTGSMTAVNGSSYISFNFAATPVEITTGTHTFDVRADIVKGSARNIQISLQQASDIMLTDYQVGVNVAISGTIPNQTTNQITIAQGTLSATVDTTFQTYTNTTGGATQVDIAKFKLHAYGEDVKVNTLKILPVISNTNPGANGLANVTVYFNGSPVGSQTVSWTSGNITLTPGSQMVIPAGVDSYLEVKADVREKDDVTNYTSGSISANLVAVSGGGQGINSQNNIDIPGQTGNVLSIQTGTIAIATDSNLSAVSVSPNTPNSEIGSFVVQNQSSSEGVHITNLQVTLALTTADSTNYTNLIVKAADGTLLGGSSVNLINPSFSTTGGTGSVNNIPVDFILAPTATKTLQIFADVGAATGSVQTKLYITGVGQNSKTTLCSPAITTGSVAGCSTGASAVGQTATVQAGTFENGGVVIGSSTAPQYIAVGIATPGTASGVTDATMATFNFKSTNGTATISEMKFLVTSSSGTTVSSVRVGSVSAPVVSNVAYLNGLNIVVPNGGQGLNVPAYMSYSAVGTNAAGFSGATSFVEITYVKYQVGNTAPTVLQGGDAMAASNTTTNTLIDTMSTNASAINPAGQTETLAFTTTTNVKYLQPGMKLIIARTATTPAIVEVQSIGTANFVAYTVVQGSGNATGDSVYFYSIPQTPDYASSTENCTVNGTEDCMAVVASKPTVSVIDASTLLVGGSPIKVGSVSVSADPKGDIAINTIPLTFTSSGYVTVSNSQITVKNSLDGSTITTSTSGGAGSSGSVLVNANGSDTANVNFTGGYTITAGSTTTFDIYVTPSTVSNGPNANHLSMALSSTPANFLWTDIAGGGTASAGTGTLIYNYPTNASVIND